MKIKVFIARLLVCALLMGMCLPVSTAFAAYHNYKDNSSGTRIVVGDVDVGYATGDIWNAGGDCDAAIRGDKNGVRGSSTGQCFGFAKHCQHAAWGCDETDGSSFARIRVGGKTTRTMSYTDNGTGQSYSCTWREYLKNRTAAMYLTDCAVHVRTMPKPATTENPNPWGHSMIILEASDSGLTIADANFVSSSEPTNQVQIRKYTWDDFFNLCDNHYTGIEYISWWNALGGSSGGGGSSSGGGSSGGGSSGGSTTTVADYIVHIDSPVGTFSGADNIEINGWIASKKDVAYAMAEVEGVMQYSLSMEHAQDVKDAYPGYAYTKRFRGAIDKNILKSNSTYNFRVWCGFADGSTTNLTTSSFSVGNIASAVKPTVIHIDRPTGTYSGSSNIEITGWVISDQAVPYVMAQVDGVTQYNLSFSHDAEVKNAYPNYATTVRFRGAIDVGKLKSNTDYNLTVWAGTADGNITYANSGFRMGNIYEENVTDYKFHVDSPRDFTFSGNGRVQVNGWIVARAPIVYVMCQLNRWTGSTFQGITQFNMDTQEDAAVKAANPGYPYARRFTCYIDAGWMQSNSEYQVYIWAGLGKSGTQVHGAEGKIWTKSVSKATYAVSYNANGGSGAPGSQTKTWNTALTLSSTIPTRTGYNFLGWSDLSTAQTAKYQPGQSYTGNAALTLYAVWQKAETISVSENKRDIPITQNLKGDRRSYLYTPPATALYRFETSGDKDTWIRLRDASGNQIAYDDNSGTNNNAKLTPLLTAGQTYYIETGLTGSSTGYFGLHFTRSFPVTFDANGGTDAPADTYYRFYDQNLTLPSAIPVCTAVISLDPAGGECTETLNISVPFDNWNTSADNSGERYAPGAIYSSNAAATLYAIWNYPQYGSLPIPVREGYVFEDWYDADGESVTEHDQVRDGITLTARWSEDNRWMNAPVITKAVNLGGGSVYLEWSAEAGADSYEIFLVGSGVSVIVGSASECRATITDLPEGSFSFAVAPVKGTQTGEHSAAQRVDIHDIKIEIAFFDGMQCIVPLPEELQHLSNVKWSFEGSPIALPTEHGDKLYASPLRAGSTVLLATLDSYTIRCSVRVEKIDDVLRLPDAMASIETEAFAGSKAIQAVAMPDCSASIEARAFSDCNSLRIAYFPCGQADIADNAFDGSDVIICAPENSPALEYAKAHGFAWCIAQ